MVRSSPAPFVAAPPWSVPRRLAFRFACVYLGLFCLVTQISGSIAPNLSFSYRGLGRLWPFRDFTYWVASAVFGHSGNLGETLNGEPLFFWVQTAWVLSVAIVAVALWTALDRRLRHDRLYAWFHLFVRVALAAALFEYGMTKVIPTQFPAPPLTTLVTPVGDLSLSALLWTSIGAAQSYEIVTGCLEVLAGVMLLVPRSVSLGAVVGLGALTQIFALNMTYDIGLKLVTLHLIALAIFLLAPDVPRLIDVFLRQRANRTSLPPPLFQSTARNRMAAAGLLVFGVYLIAMYAYINWGFWQVAGGGRPKSALYGIWDVEQLAIDGEIRPADLNDYDRRWRRVIFDDPAIVAFQRTDDSFARYGASIDLTRQVLSLSKGASRTWSAQFTFTRPAADRLVLEGVIDGYPVRAQLRRVEFDTLPLLNSRFRWVRPHDP